MSIPFGTAIRNSRQAPLHCLSHAVLGAVLRFCPYSASRRQSLVYGEIDFWSFYDVIKVAIEGMDTTPNDLQHRKRQREACVAAGGGGGQSQQRAQCEDAGGAGSPPEKEGCHESGEEKNTPVGRSSTSSRSWEDEAAAMGGGAEGGRGDGGFKFYDLGSGSGKAVFAAVLAVDFRLAKKCWYYCWWWWIHKSYHNVVNFFFYHANRREMLFSVETRQGNM